MTIALIAQDAKKELMTQFCIAYSRILSRHSLVATGTTGKMVSEATGLPIRCVMSGSQGGTQQIVSAISCDEVDMLIYLRSYIARSPNQSDYDLYKVCDSHNIPLATNIASAELLIHGLERGDLDYREMMRKANS